MTGAEITSGLSLDRQWYLYDQIGEYCPHDVHGVCPRPLTPLSSATSCATASTPTAAHETMPRTPAGTHQVSTAIVEHYQPPAKWARVFCKCNTPGHNASTCGKQSYSLPPSPLTHTVSPSSITHTLYTLSLPLLYLLFIPTLSTYSLSFITNALLETPARLLETTW